MDRKALRKDAAGVTVLHEQRIPLEADLQQAFVEHPDALPSGELGLGPLTSIGWELDLGAGPMDHLAVDTRGQLVVIEYKKGTENHDVRTVIAQLLDYGSALWRTTVDDLERACRSNRSCTLLGELVSLVDHVADVTADAVARDEFLRGLESCLSAGTFVFLYVARDLDPRTRRVLTYLADGARLRFYAVEVDWFAASDGGALLVPRVAFVPAELAAGEMPPATADPAVPDLTRRIEVLASQYGVSGHASKTGRRWGGGGQTILGVYATTTGVSFWLPEIASIAGQDTADTLRVSLVALFPDRKLPALYPSFVPTEFQERWDSGGSGVIEQLFRAVAGPHGD